MCTECGTSASKWMGRCSACGNFNTMEEEQTLPQWESFAEGTSKPVPIVSEESNAEKRVSTKIPELDRVLSGGLVEGSLTLVGGEPGVGKSTLLLQICQGIALAGESILYVSGEESVRQIQMRAQRLGVDAPSLFVLSETNVAAIEGAMKKMRPTLVIVDSIQTVYREEFSGAPGSVSQVRGCTALFMRLCKMMQISMIIVGHVTKDGAIAGPRVLEHMVDTVLYFEGERREMYRLIRAIKNRYGSTNELGVFEMRETGLVQIPNPSAYMLEGRPLDVPGSAVTCSIEGTRPILTEVQALVSATTFGTPRRMATGMDYNRAIMLIAVLEKRAGMQLGAYDSYVNIAGGLKIAEPALDAAVIAAVASSFKGKPVSSQSFVFGEVGLTGEMRAVTMAEKRVVEGYKLGFTQCVMPQANLKGIRKPKDMRVFGAANIAELLELVLTSL